LIEYEWKEEKELRGVEVRDNRFIAKFLGHEA
jgi:hypothetical protein